MKKTIRAAALTLVFLVMAGLMNLAFASEMIDLSKTGSITVGIKDTATGKYLESGELALYQVASISSGDHGFEYNWLPDYVSLGEEPAVEADLGDQLAETIAKFVAGKDQLITKKASVNGKISFSELPLGLYLIVNTTAAQGYGKINPFLVTVPLRQTDGTLSYQVNASPKAGTATAETESETETESDTEPETEPETKPNTPTNPPKTPSKTPGNGNGNKLPQTGQLWWPVPLLLLAGFLLMAAGISMRKRT